MSVEVVRSGQRRIDRVLDPRFVAGVGQLDLAELRSRREEAEAEEADISYLRRLLQGRLDILRPSWSAARAAASRTWPGCWPGCRPS
jgi:hypothetical protein